MWPSLRPDTPLTAPTSTKTQTEYQSYPRRTQVSKGANSRSADPFETSKQAVLSNRETAKQRTWHPGLIVLSLMGLTG